MRSLLTLILCLACSPAFAISACPQTVGTLTLSATIPHSTGVSPWIVFFDATATTDTATLAGANTTFQDVHYTWNFGDTGASGTGIWTNGATTGYNSKDSATGGVAAHLYVVTDGAGDRTYHPVVTATDGTNTVTCSPGTVTVYDASGANGFPTTSTVCVYASTLGAGCPTGASTLATSNYSTALGSLGSGKRLLFKCGDTFTGSGSTAGSSNIGAFTKWSIGAYGGCQNTTSNRPILDVPSGLYAFSISETSQDGRISDIDFEGANAGQGAVTETNGANAVIFGLTLYNLNSVGSASSYATTACNTCGIVSDVAEGDAAGGSIGIFINYGETQPGKWSGPQPVDAYTAVINTLDNNNGHGGTSAGVETFRSSACQYCVFNSDTFENANTVGAVFKFHNGNENSCDVYNTSGCVPPCTVGTYFATDSCWTGVYAQYIEISDSVFSGSSGSQLVEISPQDNGADERGRYITVERNLFEGTTGAQGGRLILLGWPDSTVRDNVFYVQSSSSPANQAVLDCDRANTTIGTTTTIVPTGDEFFNNTFYAYPTSQAPVLVAFQGTLGPCGGPAGNDSFVENSLMYVTSGSGTIVNDHGTGNTVADNSPTPTANPAFSDITGAFSEPYDFKPSANYSGAVSLPVFHDVLGARWSPTWDLGAVHH